VTTLNRKQVYCISLCPPGRRHKIECKIRKIQQQKWKGRTEGMAQVSEHLPSNHENLGAIPSTEKNLKKKRK
jgi:hypothetical protein